VGPQALDTLNIEFAQRYEPGLFAFEGKMARSARGFNVVGA
jgi:hypothetical protein